MSDLRSPLAIARDNYLEGKGKPLWEDGYGWKSKTIYLRNRIERAWLNGVNYGLVCSMDNRCKVAAPGWLKGKP